MPETAELFHRRPSREYFWVVRSAPFWNIEYLREHLIEFRKYEMKLNIILNLNHGETFWMAQNNGTFPSRIKTVTFLGHPIGVILKHAIFYLTLNIIEYKIWRSLIEYWISFHITLNRNNADIFEWADTSELFHRRSGRWHFWAIRSASSWSIYYFISSLIWCNRIVQIISRNIECSFRE
jgi:hypothetical protein